MVSSGAVPQGSMEHLNRKISGESWAQRTRREHRIRNGRPDAKVESFLRSPPSPDLSIPLDGCLQPFHLYFRPREQRSSTTSLFLSTCCAQLPPRLLGPIIVVEWVGVERERSPQQSCRSIWILLRPFTPLVRRTGRMAPTYVDALHLVSKSSNRNRRSDLFEIYIDWVQRAGNRRSPPRDDETAAGLSSEVEHWEG